MKKTLSILLAVCMLFALCACGNGEVAVNINVEEIQPYQFPERTPAAFEDMVMDSFDADRMQNAIDTFTTLLEKNNSFDKLCDAYDIMVDEFDNVNTDMNVAYIYYCLDVASDELYEQYYEKEEQAVFYSDAMCIALSAGMESGYADALKAYINSEDVVEDISGYTAMTDEQFELNEENSELINEYWNMDENATASDYGELYIRLLDNLIASAAYEEDYENYVDCIYDSVYFRDYAPEDSAVLYQWAKEFAVPAFFAISDTIGENYDAYTGLYSLSYSDDDIISKLQPYFRTLSPVTEKAYKTFKEYHLYDIAASDEKTEGGFTCKMYSYGVPFIFNCPYGNYSDLETIIHEFGHFAEAYNNNQPMLYAYDCIDTCEIDSQGLEMLMMKYAGELYGEEYAEVVRLANLYSMFSIIIDACIFDEFQQKAMQMRMDGTLSDGSQVTELFVSIEEEYFGEYASDFGWGENWFYVNHSFESPFYYISYGTSATAALGFLVASEKDYEGAVEMYNGLIEMGCDKGFSNTLDSLGLPNPLTEDGCARLTEGLTEYLNSLVSYDLSLYMD